MHSALSEASANLVSMRNPDDDRGEAAVWYIRMLVRHELEKGATRAELLDKLKIQKGHLSQIESGKLGLGLGTFVAFAEALGWKPGELLDAALEWWPREGRKLRSAAFREAAKRASRGAHESGEHPSQPHLKAAK